MAFHSPPTATTTPILTDLNNETGLATFSDGSTLQFPMKGAKDGDLIRFSDEGIDVVAATKKVVRVHSIKGGKEAVSFLLLEGATKTVVRTAIERCVLGV